jgi:hypothetical protein
MYLAASVHEASPMTKVTHMMHVGTAKSVRKAMHENIFLLDNYVLITILLAIRMHHIPEYIPNALGTQLSADVPSNQA